MVGEPCSLIHGVLYGIRPFILTYFMDEVFSKSNNEKTHREGSPSSLLVFAPFFSARLVFPLPPLSAPGSPTKHQDFLFLTVF